MAVDISPKTALRRQLQLLRIEYDYEREQFRQASQLAGLQRLSAHGDCWWPVTVGRSFYNSLNRLVVEVTRDTTTDTDQADHNFEPGSPVVFIEQDGLDGVRHFGWSGTVSRADDNSLLVAVPDEACVGQLRSARQAVGLQIAIDETTYRLMNEAVERVLAATDNRLATLRDVFYGIRPAATFSFEPMRFPWLNPTQESAVAAVLCAKDVAVVHGPPGTGKTTTLVEAICETLRRETQVMVCAQSNMAVDWISLQLAQRGIDVLRVGNPARVDDRMLELTYERRYEAHPDYPQLWSLRRLLRQMHNDGASAQKRDRIRDRITELEIRIHNDLMGCARVVSCTLAGSAAHVLSGTHFSTLFIDEAAQALEAACWIAIRRAGRVIFAGDHCQLPPTVKSPQAQQQGLGFTLMERIVHTQPAAVHLLTVQYRMADDIMRFPSNRFYGGRLTSAPQVAHRSILDFDTAITWVDSAEQGKENTTGSYRERTTAAGTGRLNSDEASLTLQVLANYCQQVGIEHLIDERLDIGIITPYRAQAQLLRRMLRHDERLRPLRRQITVNTIDGFQGQERDIVVLSLVRANDNGQIGFLRDLRRINVAITRARMKLIIIGHAPTLTQHPFYRSLYEYVQRLRTTPPQESTL